MSCVSSTTLSVLVNGEKLTEFAPSRGIRQGDPLSLYLFIMCMECLAWLIQVEVEGGNWIGVKPARTGPAFTHLFFADDLVLFAKATSKTCQAINRVLGKFCGISGQKVNLSKSSIFLPSRFNISRAPLLERELGFKISRSFGKYLGVPIITDGRNKQVNDFLVEKVRTKLAGWKAHTFSMVGRCILINSITSAIPTHVMQCCLLPTTISKELDKLNRNFLWRDTIEKRKCIFLIGKKLLRPKRMAVWDLKEVKAEIWLY
jgi:hypothetical protein